MTASDAVRWNAIDRPLGWLIALGGCILVLDQTVFHLDQVVAMAWWWNVGALLVTGAFVGMAIAGMVLPLPVLAVLWLMAKRVMRSDELEQRVHLLALSAATGLVCALSLVAGFLCAAGVVALDGDILLWIFPAMCLSYGASHWLLAWRYGGVGCE